MKKTLLLVAAAVALVACSKEETLVQQAPEAIGFDNAFVENSTRSVNDPSFDADNMFSDFAVYGFVEGATLFDGTRVARENLAEDQTKTGWEYAGTQYWIAGAKYNFNAVAPMTDGGWTKTDATKDATTLSFTNDGATDLLYAYATAEGKAEGNGAVAFTFRHVLSKVKFSFTNGYNATNATIRVKNIQITDALASGKVVLSNTTVWSEQAGDLTLNFGNAALTAEDNAATATEDKGLVLAYNDTIESYNELFMIPGASDTDATVENADKTTTTYTDVYTVKFTVELLVSGTEVKEYTHTVYTKFAPVAGNSYDIAATITAENIDPEHTQEPIEFTVNTLPGWGTTNNQNI